MSLEQKIAKKYALSDYDIINITSVTDEELEELIERYKGSIDYNSPIEGKFDFLLEFALSEAERRVSLKQAKRRHYEQKTTKNDI